MKSHYHVIVIYFALRASFFCNYSAVLVLLLKIQLALICLSSNLHHSLFIASVFTLIIYLIDCVADLR